MIVADAGDRSDGAGRVCCWSPPAGPNGDRLDLGDDRGARWTTTGYVVVDEHQRTTADGIFALGDVSSHHQLKHVANHEARVVQHNLLIPQAMISSDHRFVPHAASTRRSPRSD